MKLHLLAALAVCTIASSAQGAVIASFELNGSTANAVGNGIALTSNGGTLGATGIAFGINQGPTVTGLGALSEYTIDVGFRLDRVSAQNGYVKLIDFSGLTSDNGYYSLFGRLNAYPFVNSTDVVFSPGTNVRLTLSRSAAGLVTAYIDGAQIYAQADPTDLSQTRITGANPLRFFTDDTTTGGGEASSGFVDYIRIADTAVSPIEIVPPTTPPAAVPEPATWAMMLLGFGALGHTLRRRPREGVRIRFV